jgi:hypothetical protein
MGLSVLDGEIVVEAVRRRPRLTDDDGGEGDQDDDQRSGEGDVHEGNREPAAHPEHRQGPDDRIEQQSDQRRDEEDEDRVTGRAREEPAKREQERQADELNPARDLNPRRPRGRGAHVRDATSALGDWFDGALALDPDSAWDDPRLKPRRGSATVRPMSPPAQSARAVRSRREQLDARRRRLAVLLAIAVVALGTLLVTAFGGGDHPSASVPPPASASRLLPTGPPEPKVLARIGALRIQLPVNEARLTTIGYFGAEDGALALSPVGHQANEGLLRRLVHKVLGGGGGWPRWYLLPGGHGASTSALDVGAATGTDVYAPVDGTIVGIGKVILNGRAYGARVDIQPVDAPSLIVSVSHVAADPSLTVGSMVTADASKLGTVLDFSRAERQALSRYTNDAGNHVFVEVHPSATLQAR